VIDRRSFHQDFQSYHQPVSSLDYFIGVRGEPFSEGFFSVGHERYIFSLEPFGHGLLLGILSNYND